MPTYSQAILTFNDDLSLSEQVAVYDLLQQNYLFVEIWRITRQNNNEVTSGTPTNTPGERSAINFTKAMSVDYFGVFQTTRVDNIVTVNSLIEGVDFSHIRPSILSNKVDLTISNFQGQTISIVNEYFGTADSDQCNYYKFTVETNIIADYYNLNGQNYSVSSEIIELNLLRGQSFTLKIYYNNQVITIGKQINQVPSKLSAEVTYISINNSPNGNTVIVDVEQNNLILEYSLNGSEWVSSNVFPGILEGDYTLYVQDDFGCLINKNFTVKEFGVNVPFFHLSKINAMRYANRVQWGDSANYKTDDNTLSCEVDVPLPYKEIQLFHSADIIPTQLKSNYSNHEIKIIELESGTETILNEQLLEQFTNNIGRQDRRDAIKYNLENGKTGIYFLSGNTYDYTTGSVNGSYALNGYLPEWAVEGNYIRLGLAWFEIEQTFYDESKEAEVIQIGNLFTGADEVIQVSSVYNRENYEVFEFRINMVNFLDQKIQVQIKATDENFPEITHLSEVIWVKVKHENTLAIDYKNKNNNDIFYSTGIEFTLRPNIEKISGTIDQETEVNKGDTSIDLITANSYDTDVFRFQPMTKEMWKKVLYASLHSDVKYNGVSRVFKEAEVEGPLEETNIYILTITVSKSGSVYDSGSGNLEFATGDIEIPGLIETETGFVHY